MYKTTQKQELVKIRNWKFYFIHDIVTEWKKSKKLNKHYKSEPDQKWMQLVKFEDLENV